MTARSKAASITGLAIAWGGPALLISPAAERFFGDPTPVPMAFVGQGLKWLVAAVVVAMVVFWERQPLASLWLRPFRWQSIGWGLALVAVNYAVLFPLGDSVRRAAGLPGFAQGMEPVMALPLSFRMLAVLGAGVGEELLFRGYTITRLAMLTGKVWLAAALSVIGFGMLHVPEWGWGFVVGGLIGGAATTAFFVWQRDLLAMMVFHLITDAFGFIIFPMFSEWWKQAPFA